MFLSAKEAQSNVLNSLLGKITKGNYEFHDLCESINKAILKRSEEGQCNCILDINIDSVLNEDLIVIIKYLELSGYTINKFTKLDNCEYRTMINISWDIR
jgi:hypothetical protein